MLEKQHDNDNCNDSMILMYFGVTHMKFKIMRGGGEGRQLPILVVPAC